MFFAGMQTNWNEIAITVWLLGFVVMTYLTAKKYWR